MPGDGHSSSPSRICDSLSYAYATQFRDRPAYASTCEDSIYLDPAAIGQGLGTLLLAALIEASEQAGFRQMIAVVGGAEPASIKLHRKLGFRDAGRMTAVGRNIGWRLDLILASRTVADRTVSCVVQREFGASDHGPVVAVFDYHARAIDPV